MRMRPFEIESHVVAIESHIDGMKARRISKVRQLAHLDKILQHPFAAPQIIAVSSFPNDGKARLLAAFLMQAAYKAHISGKYRFTKSRQLPLWHNVFGGYYDHLRDRDEDRPSFLIISNVTHLSTPAKFEKVRDLLEKFNDIPRVLVLANEDPITIANSKLLVPLNSAFYIATAKKTVL